MAKYAQCIIDGKAVTAKNVETQFADFQTRWNKRSKRDRRTFRHALRPYLEQNGMTWKVSDKEYTIFDGNERAVAVVTHDAKSGNVKIDPLPTK